MVALKTTTTTTTISSRAASLPREMPHSSALLSETNALTQASRNNDLRMLQDITSKVNATGYVQPYATTRVTTYVTKKPPVPPLSHGFSDRHARHALIYSTNDVYDDVMLTPITSRIIRSARATSVPPEPVLRRAASMHYLPLPVDGYTSVPSSPRKRCADSSRAWTGVYDALVDAVAPDNNTSYHSNQSQRYPVRTTHLTPVADLAVKQAHRYLERIHRELHTSNQTANLDENLLPRASRRMSYDGPITTRVLSVPSQTSRVLSVPSQTSRVLSVPSQTSRVLSVPSQTSRVPTTRRYVATTPTPRRHTVVNIQDDLRHLLDDDFRKLVKTSLIRPTTTPSVGDQHNYKLLKIVPSVSTQSSADQRVSRTLKRTPPEPTRALSQPDLDRTHMQFQLVSRPKVSQIRQKVRSVLCKTRHDPNYYD